MKEKSLGFYSINTTRTHTMDDKKLTKGPVIEYIALSKLPWGPQKVIQKGVSAEVIPFLKEKGVILGIEEVRHASDNLESATSFLEKVRSGLKQFHSVKAQEMAERMVVSSTNVHVPSFPNSARDSEHWLVQQ